MKKTVLLPLAIISTALFISFSAPIKDTDPALVGKWQASIDGRAVTLIFDKDGYFTVMKTGYNGKTKIIGGKNKIIGGEILSTYYIPDIHTSPRSIDIAEINSTHTNTKLYKGIYKLMNLKKLLIKLNDAAGEPRPLKFDAKYNHTGPGLKKITSILDKIE